jgi:hypothetical protein
MPSPEGHLTLRLYRCANSRVQVEVISSRPQLAARLFQGKTPDETAELAGRFFTLCGQAQRLAAVAACTVAGSNYLGASRHPSLSKSKEGNTEITTFRSFQQAVLVETTLEHAWRLLIDWSGQAGLPPDMSALRNLRQAAVLGSTALADVLDALLEHNPPAMTLPPIIKTLSPLVGENGNVGLLPPAPKLNPTEADTLAWRALEEPAFCTRPLWRDQPAETGALARQQQHPLLANLMTEPERRIDARWLARRLELAELPTRLRHEPTDLLVARPLTQNHGYAWVETARGVLLHVVRLEQGRVAAYRIIAPTEWNFHPNGPFASGIAALGETADLATAAQALALSLDPCVSYQVEVVDA